MPYTDEAGITYQMTIVRHFTLGAKQFVLAVEKEHHHHEGEVCLCHDHHHGQRDDDAAQEKALYVFEWIREEKEHNCFRSVMKPFRHWNPFSKPCEIINENKTGETET